MILNVDSNLLVNRIPCLPVVALFSILLHSSSELQFLDKRQEKEIEF